MLSLIIPPIVLVLALAFLVYFFSKRLPTLQARIDRGEIVMDEAASTSVWWDRVKHAILSLLEKNTRRWKVGLLKAHNQAHEMTDNLRRRKEASRNRLLRSEELQQDQQAAFSQPEEKVLLEAPVDDRPMVGQLTLPTSSSERVNSVVVLKTKQRGESILPPQSSTGRQSSRFVRRSDRIVPRRSASAQEESSNNNQSKEQLEAILIERIVTNPKDVEAYERLGDYYLEQESLTDAKECYRQVLKLSPVNRLVKIKIRRLERVLEKR